MPVPEFSWESDMLSFIESCPAEDLHAAFEQAVRNHWPAAFLAAVDRMIQAGIEPHDLIRQVLNDAAWGRFAMRGFKSER